MTTSRPRGRFSPTGRWLCLVAALLAFGPKDLPGPTTLFAALALRGDGCSGSATQCSLITGDVDNGDICFMGTGIRDSNTATLDSWSDGAATNAAPDIRVDAPEAGSGDNQREYISTIVITDDGGGSGLVWTPAFTGSAATQVTGACYSGLPATYNFSSAFGSTDDGQSFPCGAGVSANAGDLIVSFSTVSTAYTGGNPTAATGFNERVEDSRHYFQDNILVAGYSGTGAWTTNANEDVVNACLVLHDTTDDVVGLPPNSLNLLKIGR